MSLRFTVPGLPIAWARAGTNGKRRFTPKRTADYEALVRLTAVQAGAVPIDGPLQLSVKFYMPIPSSWSKRKQAQARTQDIWPTSRPDADNLLKSVSDALNTVAYLDDKQIVICHAEKWFGDTPRAEVEVTEL